MRKKIMVETAQEPPRPCPAKMPRFLLAGMGGGLIGGALIGIAEASWLATRMGSFPENSIFWWGPLAYGLAFASAGLVIAAVLALFSLLLRKSMDTTTICAVTLGSSILLSAVIAIWRYKRDVLMSHALTASQWIGFLAVFTAAALVAAFATAMLGRLLGKVTPRKSVTVAVVPVLFLALVGGGAGYSRIRPITRPATKNVSIANATGPNIVLIAIDTLRADYLKLYEPQAAAVTPGLEQFAKDAVLFEEAFAQAPWTKPSFGTIFSGMYPSAHKATAKGLPLAEDIVTFPELLHDAGYYTMGFANNGNLFSVYKFNQGFDHYVDLRPGLHFFADESASHLAIYQILRVVRHGIRARLTNKISILDFNQPADLVTGKALKLLDSSERPNNTPFFLFLHYMDPHEPFIDRKRNDTSYVCAVLQPSVPGGKKALIDPAKYRQPMIDAYNSDLEFTDRHVAALLDGLRSRGLYENSLIVLTSDHGEEFYDHKGWWHAQSLFDELLHVPLIVKLPGNSSAGTRNPHFARHLDLAPTILSLAGLQPDAHMIGQPLVNQDGSANNAAIDYIYAENDIDNIVLQGIRTRTQKIIRANPDNPRNYGTRQFYDLVSDPLEQQDLTSSGDPRVERLDTFLHEVMAVVGSGKPAPPLPNGFQEQLNQGATK